MTTVEEHQQLMMMRGLIALSLVGAEISVQS